MDNVSLYLPLVPNGTVNSSKTDGALDFCGIQLSKSDLDFFNSFADSLADPRDNLSIGNLPDDESDESFKAVTTVSGYSPIARENYQICNRATPAQLMNLGVTLRNKGNSSSSFGSIPENLSNSMSQDAFDNLFQQTNFPKHEAIYSNYISASEATLFYSPGGAQTDALIAASLQETLFLLSPPSKPQPQNFSILNPSEINSSCLPLPPLPSKKAVSKRPDLIERRKLHRKEAESQRRRLIAKYAEELKQLTPKAMVRNISQEKVINSAVEFILHLQHQAIEKKKEIKQLELQISLLKAGIKC